MSQQIVLASGSAIRARLLENARIPFSVQAPRVDEETVKASLLADEVAPRDIADALAELKAGRVSSRNPGAMVIGCDQVLDFDGRLLSKPKSPQEALEQLKELRGRQHKLFSAAVICENGRPVWRHIGQVRLRMRENSDQYLKGYVDRNWPSIRNSVGGYKLEEEGVRLFAAIDGNYFNVFGMPLLELIAYLTLRGVLEQ